MSEAEKEGCVCSVLHCFVLRSKWPSRAEQWFSAAEEDLNTSPLVPSGFLLWGSHSPRLMGFRDARRPPCVTLPSLKDI